jgi:hypothetical protein
MFPSGSGVSASVILGFIAVEARKENPDQVVGVFLVFG